MRDLVFVAAIAAALLIPAMTPKVSIPAELEVRHRMYVDLDSSAIQDATRLADALTRAFRAIPTSYVGNLNVTVRIDAPETFTLDGEIDVR